MPFKITFLLSNLERLPASDSDLY
uniref:Uncharacterized protein n=1 Tax=Anguilla anguilla TaxID=7936 RepID=A0A0E9TGR8_ANGAN